MDVEAIYEANFGRIYGFYYKKTLHVHSAEDLTSQAFLRFAEQSSLKKPRKPEKYLYGIVHNIWLEYLRAKYASQAFLSDVASEGIEQPEHDIQDSLLQSQLINQVNRLPEKQKQIIELRYVCGLRPVEIAVHLQKDSSYVKTTHARAIASLRTMLEEGGKL
jgi:RNA polymerase sigma-70 factor, ECF subfamily